MRDFAILLFVVAVFGLGIILGWTLAAAEIERLEVPVVKVVEVPVIVEKVQLVPVTLYKEVVVRQWCAISYGAQEVRCVDKNGDIIVIP